MTPRRVARLPPPFVELADPRTGPESNQSRILRAHRSHRSGGERAGVGPARTSAGVVYVADADAAAQQDQV